MNLSYDEMHDVNEVQLEIFREFTKVCKILGLKYYMIHGSLLGTLRYDGFFPYDDDIDVAMPRQDYDILIRDGQKHLPGKLFVQSCETEKEYPLSFAKIRNSETAFIQPIMHRYNINKGIYIDIFPLDYYPESNITKLYLNLKEKVYNARISTRMTYDEKQPFFKSVFRFLSIPLCPSWYKAVKKRSSLYASVPKSSLVITVGGKVKERGIPDKWFGEGISHQFEDSTAICPDMYHEYLSCIYGDYQSYNPAEKYMNSDGTVMVSADIVDTNKSYKDFC